MAINNKLSKHTIKDAWFVAQNLLISRITKNKHAFIAKKQKRQIPFVITVITCAMSATAKMQQNLLKRLQKEQHTVI